MSSVALPVVNEFCYYAYYTLLTSELAWELRTSWGGGDDFVRMHTGKAINDKM